MNIFMLSYMHLRSRGLAKYRALHFASYASVGPDSTFYYPPIEWDWRD